MTTTADKKSPTPPRSKATACDLVTVFKTYSRWPPQVYGETPYKPHTAKHMATQLCTVEVDCSVWGGEGNMEAFTSVLCAYA